MSQSKIKTIRDIFPGQQQQQRSLRSHVGRELARCLAKISLDVIGIIEGYSQEFRMKSIMNLDETLQEQFAAPQVIVANTLVTSKQHLVVISDKIYVYDTKIAKPLHIALYPRNLCFIDATIDYSTDIIYALVCEHEQNVDTTQMNPTRVLYRITLTYNQADRGMVMERLVDLVNICPDTHCIRHHNGQFYVANASILHIFSDTICDNDKEKQQKSLKDTEREHKKLAMCDGFNRNSIFVALAIDPSSSTVYSWENFTNYVRVLRPTTDTESKIWIKGDGYSFMIVLETGNVVGLDLKTNLATALILFQPDGTVIDKFAKPRLINKLIRDVNDNIYFFERNKMYVMSV